MPFKPRGHALSLKTLKSSLTFHTDREGLCHFTAFISYRVSLLRPHCRAPERRTQPLARGVGHPAASRLLRPVPAALSPRLLPMSLACDPSPWACCGVVTVTGEDPPTEGRPRGRASSPPTTGHPWGFPAGAPGSRMWKEQVDISRALPPPYVSAAPCASLLAFQCVMPSCLCAASVRGRQAGRRPCASPCS